MGTAVDTRATRFGRLLRDLRTRRGLIIGSLVIAAVEGLMVAGWRSGFVDAAIGGSLTVLMSVGIVAIFLRGTDP